MTKSVVSFNFILGEVKFSYDFLNNSNGYMIQGYTL